MWTVSPRTKLSGPLDGAVEESAARVRLLRVPRAGKTAPPKTMRVPRPRAAG